MLTILRDMRGAYLCRFGYNPAVIAELKAAVPHRWRRWAPQRGCWVIDRCGWPAAESVFMQYGLLAGGWRASQPSAAEPGVPV